MSLSTFLVVASLRTNGRVHLTKSLPMPSLIQLLMIDRLSGPWMSQTLTWYTKTFCVSCVKSSSSQKACTKSTKTQSRNPEILRTQPTIVWADQRRMSISTSLSTSADTAGKASQVSKSCSYIKWRSAPSYGRNNRSLRIMQFSLLAWLRLRRQLLWSRSPKRSYNLSKSWRVVFRQRRLHQGR